MIKIKLIIGLIFLNTFFIKSQDIITKKTGEDIEAKIIEIGINEVKFKKFNNIDGPLFVLPKSDILLIRYKNGDKEIFENIKSSVLSMNNASFTNWKEKGEEDARKFYKGSGTYRGASGGTFFVSFLFGPLFGLIPAISSSKVKQTELRNLHYPNIEYFENVEYRDAYIKRSHRRRVGKIWGAYTAGSILFGVFVGGATVLATGGLK